MARAFSPTEILSKKYKTLNWSDEFKNAFSCPEITGIWFVYGNSSNGKTAFVMQLAKELGSLGLGKVFFNSLEQGTRKTMQEVLRVSGVDGKKHNIMLGSETFEELEIRLDKRKSPHVVVIDSVQYANVRTATINRFNLKFKHKLIIYISQTEGLQPKGNVARDLRYQADLKIWVEGFKAISQGRYNPGGELVIWKDGADKYWNQQKNNKENKYENGKQQ